MPEASIADILARLRARADAVGVRIVALPPVPPSKIAELSARNGGLCGEMAEIMTATGGMQFGTHLLDFADGLVVGQMPPPAHSPWRLFPRRLELGAGPDGARYFADLGRPDLPSAPVFALWPDPPVLMLVARSLKDFLLTITRTMPAKGDGSMWDFDPLKATASVTQSVAKLSRSAHKVTTRYHTRRLGDPVLTAYADQLPPGAKYCDLRQLQPGTGFAWAGQRRVDAFFRHPTELIFAFTVVRRKWRPTAWLLGRPSRRERRQWLRDFELTGSGS